MLLDIRLYYKILEFEKSEIARLYIENRSCRVGWMGLMTWQKMS